MIYRTIRHFTSHDGTHYNCGKEIGPAEFAQIHESDRCNFMEIADGPRLVSVPQPKKNIPIPETGTRRTSWDPPPGLGFNYPYNLFV